MARLFVGIPIPEPQRKTLSVVGEINEEVKGVRWVPVVNYHLTLYFLGEVEEEMLDNLFEVIRNGYKKVTPFTLSFDRFEFAPKGEVPRMLWGKWRQHSLFIRLVERTHYLYTQLNPTYSYRKRPVPHVTLARFGKEVDIQDFSFEGVRNPVDIEVGELVLWRSLRQKEASPRYEELIRVSLAKEDL